MEMIDREADGSDSLEVGVLSAQVLVSDLSFSGFHDASFDSGGHGVWFGFFPA